MKIDCGDRLCIRTSDDLKTEAIAAFVEYRGEHHDILRISSGKWRREATDDGVRVTDGRFSLNFREREGKIFVSGKFRADRPFCGVRFCFLKGRLDSRFDKMYTNGGSEFNGVLVQDMQAYSGVSALMKNEERESLDFAVGVRTDGSCVVAGAVTYRVNFSAVRLSENGGMELFVPLYDRPTAEGEEIASDEFVLFLRRDLNAALGSYAAETAKQSGGGACPGKALSGWCSWYYYGRNISEEIILRNMNDLKRRRVPVECIQIDAGWSGKYGDWEPNDRFPHGMKWLADRIREAGFLPGIWVAPLSAESDSSFFRTHRDLFVKKRDCEGAFRQNPLDLSRIEAQKFLYDLFRKLSVQWGYRYIKFDFSAFGFSAGSYSDPSHNGVKNYRRALEIMRAAVTEDTFLLACTSPLSASIGFAQGIRIGKDIFERWESLKEVAAQVLPRLYLNDVIRADPDCLLLRTAESEEDDCFRLCTRTEAEIDTFLALVGVSGGNVMLSDKVALLPESRLEKFRTLFPLNQTSGVPADLTVSAIPSVVDCGERRGIRTIVLFNWEDMPQRIRFPLGKEYRIFDFFSRSFSGNATEADEVLSPHESRVLHCSAPNGCLAGAFGRMIPEVDCTEATEGVLFSGLKAGEKLLCRFRSEPKKTEGCRTKTNENGMSVLFADGGDAAVWF